MTSFQASILMLAVTLVANGLVALAVYGIKGTVKQTQLSIENSLLLLQRQIEKDFRTEFASQDDLDGLKERVNLSDQMRTGFDSVHKVLGGVPFSLRAGDHHSGR